MNALAIEAATGLRRLAEPIPAGDRVKRQIERAARACGLMYSRAFDLWYRKARRIDAAEIEAIRAAAAQRSRERNDAWEAIADDFEALAERAAALAARTDRQSADRMRALALRVRRLAPGE